MRERSQFGSTPSKAGSLLAVVAVAPVLLVVLVASVAAAESIGLPVIVLHGGILEAVDGAIGKGVRRNLGFGLPVC